MDIEFEKMMASSNAFSDEEKAALKDLYPNMDKKTFSVIQGALTDEMTEREKVRNERDGALLVILEEDNA